MAASKAKKTSKGRKAASSSSRRNSGTAAKRRTKSGSGARQNRRPAQTKGIGREIRLCLILALSVLLLLANIGVIGRYGAEMSDALFGVFGLMAYVFPFVLFFGYAFILANRGNPLLVRKCAGLMLLFVFMSAFLQLLTLGISRRTPILDFYRICAEDHTGGGVIGAGIAWVFSWVFGLIGAYVLTISGLVISSIIMTQKPLLSQLGLTGRAAARTARQKRQTRLDEIRRRREAELKDWEDREEQRLAEEERRLEARRKEAASRQKEAEARRKRQQTAAAKRKPAAVLSDPACSKREKRSPADGTPDSRAYEDVLNAPLYDQDNPLAYVTLTSPAGWAAGDAGSSPDTSDMEDFFALPAEPEPVSAGRSASAVSSAVTELPEEDEPELAPFTMPSFLEQSRRESRTEDVPYSGAVLEEERPEAVKEVRAEEAGAVQSAPPAPRSSGSRRAGKADPGVEDVAVIQEEIEKTMKQTPVYRLPDVSLLTKGKPSRGDSQQTLMNTAAKLQKTLADFGVNVRVVNVSCGPTVTRYELQPEQGVKVSRILSLQDDIKLNLAAEEIRIEAPIPGKAAVGIEVPNKETSAVMLRDIIDSPEFEKSRATLAFAVGKDIGGKNVVTDIEKMPHLLIAGATGSGKSVCINTLIMSILFKAKPDEVKMLMIDPKVVELKIYDGIPHLLIPVVTDPKKAAGALDWAVREMTERYQKFAQYPGVRDIRSYNKKVEELNRESDEASRLEKLPRIVIIVDELADLMMVASSEVEDAICRLAQLARAAGIHLIIATQRPSVNVVTGLIKANMPSRIALSVTSSIDSRTILDMHGAEKLLGHGDMLFYPQSYPKPARVQGAYVSDKDITEVVNFLVLQTQDVEYNKEIEEQIDSGLSASVQAGQPADDGRDEYFAEAGRLVIQREKASIGRLQRDLKVGFNRAARIMDQLAEAGVVSGEEGTKPRRVLMKLDEFEQYLLGGSESA